MRSRGQAHENRFNKGDRVQHVISKRVGNVIGSYASQVTVLFDGDSYRTHCLARRLERVSDPGDTT